MQYCSTLGIILHQLIFMHTVWKAGWTMKGIRSTQWPDREKVLLKEHSESDWSYTIKLPTIGRNNESLHIEILKVTGAATCQWTEAGLLQLDFDSDEHRLQAKGKKKSLHICIGYRT